MSNLGLKQLGKNTSLTLGRQMLTALLGLLTAIILARLLGPNGNGVYQMVLLLPTMVVTLSNLGIGSGTVYYVARRDYSLQTIITANLVLAIIISAIACIIAVLLVHFCGDKLFPGIPKSLLLDIILVIPISILQSYLLTVFQGLQDFKVYNRISIVPQAVILLLVVLEVWVLGGGVKAAIVAYILGNIFALMMTIYYLNPYIDYKLAFDKEFAEKIIGYGIKVHLSNILAFLNYRLDMFLLNCFLNPAAVGLYSIAVQIAERLWIISQAVSTVMLPRISELKDDEESRRQITPLISRWVFFITTVGSIILMLIAPFLIPLLFGDKFSGAVLAFEIMIPGIILGSTSRVLANDFAARGQPEINMYISILALAINVIINLILIPIMGINGASLATTISYGCSTCIKIIIYSKITGVTWYKTFVPESKDFKLILKLIRLDSKVDKK